MSFERLIIGHSKHMNVRDYLHQQDGSRPFHMIRRVVFGIVRHQQLGLGHKHHWARSPTVWLGHLQPLSPMAFVY